VETAVKNYQTQELKVEDTDFLSRMQRQTVKYIGVKRCDQVLQKMNQGRNHLASAGARLSEKGILIDSLSVLWPIVSGKDNELFPSKKLRGLLVGVLVQSFWGEQAEEDVAAESVEAQVEQLRVFVKGNGLL
jgi:hypothetical protein